MIPLDHHFTELLNETIPFPLPKASETTAPKVVPTLTATAKPERVVNTSTPPKLGDTLSVASAPLTSSTFNCQGDLDCDTVSKSPATGTSRSKVEISTERSVPFKIDTRMMINRRRLTLQDSGLPVSLRPTEADPSIVGNSVLGLKLEPQSPSPLSEAQPQEQKIRSDVSDAIVDLLEQRPEVSDRPSLKAFNPEELATDLLEGKPKSATKVEHDKTLDPWLQENSFEVDDETEEYGLVEEQPSADAVTEEDLDESETIEGATSTEEAAKETFFPMLQVDRFAWPDFCLDMHPIVRTQLVHLGDQLIAKSASGRKVVAVVGSGPGAGSTSILLGLATTLEAAGQRVAMIDANFNSPTLAGSLGLQPEQGWETVVSGKLPVEESMVESVEDRIALLPLCLDASKKITFGVRSSEKMNDAVAQMKEHYDLVIVDLGSPGAADVAAFSSLSEWIDSAVVVHNLRDGTRAQLIQTKNLMRDYGVSVAGIAENFAPREACLDDRHGSRAA